MTPSPHNQTMQEKIERTLINHHLPPTIHADGVDGNLKHATQSLLNIFTTTLKEAMDEVIGEDDKFPRPDNLHKLEPLRQRAITEVLKERDHLRSSQRLKAKDILKRMTE